MDTLGCHTSQSGGDPLSLQQNEARPPHTFAVLAGGALIIGSLDIAYAIIFSAFRGFGPVRILQSVAAGLLGRAAFRGGVPTAMLGLALHYTISLGIVLVYWIMSRSLEVLTRRPVICGAIYGLLVYIVMNYVVIPLSATSRPRFLLLAFVCSVLVHAFLIGVPAALFARAARTRSR
jgi:hypothetical protein